MPIPRITGYTRGPKGYSWVNPYTEEIEYSEEPPARGITGTPAAEALTTGASLPEGYVGTTPPTLVRPRVWEAEMPIAGQPGLVEHYYGLGPGTVGEGRGFTAWERPTITPQKHFDDTLELMYKGMLSQVELEYDDDLKKAKNTNDPNWSNYANTKHLIAVQKAESFRERYRLEAKQIIETDKFDDEQKAIAFYKLLDKAESDAPIKIAERIKPKEPTLSQVQNILRADDNGEITLTTEQRATLEQLYNRLITQMTEDIGITPITPAAAAPIDRTQHLIEFRRLGGDKTPEGRAYKQRYLQPIATPTTPTALPRPKTREERDRLPKGTSYIDPEGKMRIR